MQVGLERVWNFQVEWLMKYGCGSLMYPPPLYYEEKVMIVQQSECIYEQKWSYLYLIKCGSLASTFHLSKYFNVNISTLCTHTGKVGRERLILSGWLINEVRMLVINVFTTNVILGKVLFVKQGECTSEQLNFHWTRLCS